jgi:hypothetical protein
MNPYHDLTVGGIGHELQDLGVEMCKRRGHESATELQFARLNLRLRSLEQIVLRQGGTAQ